jgi:hypothetical protein
LPVEAKHGPASVVAIQSQDNKRNAHSGEIAMSVDTKGLMHSPVKDVLHVMSIVDSTLRKFVKTHMPEGRPAHGWGLPDGFKYPVMRLTSDAQSVYSYFTIAGEQRNLQICFSCDCDNIDTHPGMKVKFSLGNWGLSVPIMTELMSRLTHLGPCYIDESDCDDVGYVEVEAKPMSFIEAVMQGYNSVLHADDWVRVHSALPKSHKKPLAQFLGLTAEELAQYQENSSAIFDICKGYEAAAKATKEVSVA